MAKKVTLIVPKQKVIFDPFRTLRKIHWEDKKGTWCSCGIYLNNLGVGGASTLTLTGLTATADPFVIVLGTDGDGNHSFYNFRENFGAPVPDAIFKQKVTLSDGTLMQAYGVREFDAGDSHNGSEFYFKAPDHDFTALVTATSTVATPPYARIWQNPFSPTVQNIEDFADGVGFADAHFDFEIEDSVKNVTYTG